MKHAQVQQKNCYDECENALDENDTQEYLIIERCVVEEVVEIKIAAITVMIHMDPLATVCPRV